MDDLRLAALLFTRLCHDLIGPTGAVANGVELLVEDVSGVDEGVVELIQHSAGAATRRLKFFRAALGVAVEGQTLDDARKLAEGYFEGGKIETDWSGAALASGTPLPLGFVPILLNLLLCAAASLPRGGGVGIGAAAAGDGLAIRIEAAGPAIKLDDDTLRSLAGKSTLTALDARDVAPHFTFRLVAAAGSAIEVSRSPKTAVFSVNLPRAT